MFQPRVLLFFVGVSILGTESYTSTSSYQTPMSESSSSSYSSGYTAPTSPSVPAYGASYGASAYGASYGAPVYGASSYGAPVYGASSYGAPGYGASSYGAPGYGASIYPSYGAPAYNSYGQGYGYGYGSSSGYGSCESTKVIEVLDSFFCQHGARKRYSSTIYPTIDVVIDQLEYLLDYIFLQTVYDYLESAKNGLETIQDVSYTNFEYSTLLQSYYEGNSGGQTDETSGTGTSAASPGRTHAANKLATADSKLKVHEANAKTFKTNRGLKMQKKGAQAQHASSNTKTKTKTLNDALKQRTSEGSLLDLTLVDIVEGTSGKVSRAVPERDQELVKSLQKRMSQLKRDARSSTRKARGSDYSDYSCAYLTPTYCDYSKYDELLYNLLERIWTVLDFLDQAAFETWLFMQEISCDTDDDRWALEEAAITFGSIVTSFYTMLEVAYDIEKMYELVELDYGEDSSYYRAGGSSSTSQSQPQQPTGMVSVQVPMMRRPMGMAVNRNPTSQGYPFAQYMSQPQSPASYSSYSNYPSYSQQQQYRVSRASVSQQPLVPGTSHSVGSPTSAHAPSVLVLG